MYSSYKHSIFIISILMNACVANVFAKEKTQLNSQYIEILQILEVKQTTKTRTKCCEKNQYIFDQYFYQNLILILLRNEKQIKDYQTTIPKQIESLMEVKIEIKGQNCSFFDYVKNNVGAVVWRDVIIAASFLKVRNPESAIQMLTSIIFKHFLKNTNITDAQTRDKEYEILARALVEKQQFEFLLQVIPVKIKQTEKNSQEDNAVSDEQYRQQPIIRVLTDLAPNKNFLEQIVYFIEGSQDGLENKKFLFLTQFLNPFFRNNNIYGVDKINIYKNLHKNTNKTQFYGKCEQIARQILGTIKCPCYQPSLEQISSFGIQNKVEEDSNTAVKLTNDLIKLISNKGEHLILLWETETPSNYDATPNKNNQQTQGQKPTISQIIQQCKGKIDHIAKQIRSIKPQPSNESDTNEQNENITSQIKKYNEWIQTILTQKNTNGNLNTVVKIDKTTQSLSTEQAPVAQQQQTPILEKNRKQEQQLQAKINNLQSEIQQLQVQLYNQKMETQKLQEQSQQNYDEAVYYKNKEQEQERVNRSLQARLQNLQQEVGTLNQKVINQNQTIQQLSKI